MANSSIDRVRTSVMFVMAWLIGLYVYEIVQETFAAMQQAIRGPIGFVAALATLALNLYARKRAAACDPSSRAFKFWLYLPVGLFLALPLVVKVIFFLTSDEQQSWWDHLVSLLPVLLKLGVPVAALLWAYMALGRLRPRNEEGEAAERAPSA